LTFQGANLATDAGSGTAEVAAGEWIAFFDSFSRQHEGWLTSITAMYGKEQLTEVRDARLKGISCDHLSDRDEIYISVGSDDIGHLRHAVKSPARVVFRQDLRDSHEGIEIVSADGTLTSIRFRAAARPESLNGVLPETHLAMRTSPGLVVATQPWQAEAQGHAGEIEFHIPADRIMLKGNLSVPKDPRGVVLFAHGSGSSRFSSRNRYVADVLRTGGFATLLIDLLTETEEEENIDERTAALRFDIERLSRRLVAATWWLKDQSATANLPIGYFGANTGAAAALVAAAEVSDLVSAVVSRGGRPDLTGNALHKVIATTLLIVGSNDTQVTELNRQALDLIPAQKDLQIIPGASHLFEEPGSLEKVAELASNWFRTYLASARDKSSAA
jgi:dienelactone hydrolase